MPKSSVFSMFLNLFRLTSAFFLPRSSAILPLFFQDFAPHKLNNRHGSKSATTATTKNTIITMTTTIKKSNNKTQHTHSLGKSWRIAFVLPRFLPRSGRNRSSYVLGSFEILGCDMYISGVFSKPCHKVHRAL